MLNDLKKELRASEDRNKAVVLKKFFKTAPGQYGEGDIFLGINVPKIRQIAKKYLDLNFNEIEQLLSSRFNEHRLIALIILITLFKKGGQKERGKIYHFYINHIENINNWNLVDTSAPVIVGQWLLQHPKDILYKFARSKKLWQKRIAIIATLGFIRAGEFEDTFKISEILLQDKHDLIHKAVGWMLREVGKKNEPLEKRFLDEHCKKMPRTMLRYAIERFNKKDYQYYLLCSK